MKNLKAKIAELESRLAVLEPYKPAYGHTKPHLPHEQMMKLGPSEHMRLSKEHATHAQTAQKAATEAARGGRNERGEQTFKHNDTSNQHRDLAFKHNDMSNMHYQYAQSRTGTESARPHALQKAKQYHHELSNS